MSQLPTIIETKRNTDQQEPVSAELLRKNQQPRAEDVNTPSNNSIASTKGR
jgi:hypothetical protein